MIIMERAFLLGCHGSFVGGPRQWIHFMLTNEFYFYSKQFSVVKEHRNCCH